MQVYFNKYWNHAYFPKPDVNTRLHYMQFITSLKAQDYQPYLPVKYYLLFESKSHPSGVSSLFPVFSAFCSQCVSSSLWRKQQSVKRCAVYNHRQSTMNCAYSRYSRSTNSCYAVQQTSVNRKDIVYLLNNKPFLEWPYLTHLQNFNKFATAEKRSCRN